MAGKIKIISNARPAVKEPQVKLEDLKFEALSLVDAPNSIESGRIAVAESLANCAKVTDWQESSNFIVSLCQARPELMRDAVLPELISVIGAKDSSQTGPALLAIGQLSNVLPEQAQPYLLPLLTQILDKTLSKQKEVSQLALVACRNVVKQSHSHLAPLIMARLFEAMDTRCKAPKRVAALSLLEDLAAVSQKVVASKLADVILPLQSCMADFNPEVAKAAVSAMTSVAAVISNPDLDRVITIIVSSLADYKNVPDCVKALSATTFVRDIESPTLSLVSPIILRSLTDRISTKCLRQTCVILDNICKMVADPRVVVSFLPQFIPGIEHIIEMGADPELRDVATNTLKTMSGIIESSRTSTSSQKSLDRRMICTALKTLLVADMDAECALYIADIMSEFTCSGEFDTEEWHLLEEYAPKGSLKVEALREKCIVISGIDRSRVEDHNHEILCNCDFSLGYGGMVLLKQANLTLKRGDRYGVVGRNGTGKTTLLKAISNGQVEGFPAPDKVKTVYVAHVLQGDATKVSIDSLVRKRFPQLDDSEITDAMVEFGFTEERRSAQLSSLSGGWKMKLELAMAILEKADILLLDEPTNHLDAAHCQWLEKYLISRANLTSVIVSHDERFLDAVCTNIIHLSSNKLTYFHGNFSKFVKLVPEAATYLASDLAAVTFHFPDPGNLDNIKSDTRKILRIQDVSFQYPTAPKPALININVGITIKSRVAVLGPNGAGKSTLLKILTGEMYPTTGKLIKHPTLRIAYVAQHAFHHLEQHLETSPNEYIRWRFQAGVDKEIMMKDTRTLSPEAEAIKDKLEIEFLCGRQKVKRSYKYEVKYVGRNFDDTRWISKEELEEWGLKPMTDAFDDVESSRAGNYDRELTVASVEAHLKEFGLEPEFGTHNVIKGLSGGQKVKVVLAAAMWLKPHLLILDEPSNYLDMASLNALAAAIDEFKGGVLMVTHNAKFHSEVCNEQWHVEGGKLRCVNLIDGKQTASTVTDDNTAETSPVEMNGNAAAEHVKTLAPPEKEQKLRKKVKETRRERIRKEKVKIEKLFKYGPKANGEPYSSDEEPEDKHIHI